MCLHLHASETFEQEGEGFFMTDQKQKLSVTVEADERVSAEEHLNATQSLRAELLDTNADQVDFVMSSEVPDGTRAVEAITLGALALTLASSGGVLTTIIGALKDWLTRNHEHSISLEIDGDKISITGASSQQEERLIREWIKRHKK